LFKQDRSFNQCKGILDDKTSIPIPSLFWYLKRVIQSGECIYYGKSEIKETLMQCGFSSVSIIDNFDDNNKNYSVIIARKDSQ